MCFYEYDIEEGDKCQKLKDSGFQVTVTALKQYDFSHPPRRQVEGSEYQPTFRYTEPPRSPTKKRTLYQTDIPQPLSPVDQLTQELLSLTDPLNKSDPINNSRLSTNLQQPYFTNVTQEVATQASPRKAQLTKLGSQMSELGSIYNFNQPIEWSPPFAKCIVNNEGYQNISLALQQFDLGHYQKALNLLETTKQDAFDQMINVARHSQAYKEAIFVQLQATAYAAVIHRCRGKNSIAIDLLQGCLKKFQVAEPTILGQMYMELGHNYHQQTKLCEALDEYVKALILYESNKWQQEAGLALAYIAQIYSYFKLFEEAKKIAYQALDFVKASSNPDMKKVAQVHYSLGVVYQNHKDYVFALQHYEQCLELRLGLTGLSHQSIAQPLNSIGICQMLNKDLDIAERNFIRAYSTFGDDAQISKAQILNNIGLCYSMKNDLVSAQRAFEKSLHFYRHYFDESHPLIKRARRNIALLYEHLDAR